MTVPESVSGRPVLLRLTSLRTVAALMVFGFHLTSTRIIRVHPVLPLGFTGVAFFFVLSGFVLTWSLPPAMTAQRFWRNRFARIYPATLVTLLLGLALPAAPHVTALHELPSILMIQAWFPDSDVINASNIVTWSLSCEFAFYAVLPFAARWLSARRPGVRWSVAVGYWATSAGLVALITYRYEHAAGAVVATFYNPAVHFGEFLLGVVLALEIRDGRRLSLWAAGLLTLVSLVSLHFSQVGALPDAEMTPLFVAAIALAAQRDLVRPHSFFTRRAFVYAGEVSFCFYLVHVLVIIHRGSHLAYGKAAAAVLLVISCLLAAALHHIVEVPFQRLIRGRASAQLSVATHPFGTEAERQ